jgi:hypothetical protein
LAKSSSTWELGENPTYNLLVPQDREDTFSTHLFARYSRNEKRLVLALVEMYVRGLDQEGQGGNGGAVRYLFQKTTNGPK